VTPKLESARADWERDILDAANAVQAEDGRLQRDVSALSASMKAEFEAIGRSETTPNETRFTDAERFTFNEMKRNMNSDTVRMIRELLREPKWYELFRDYGSDITTALAMFAGKVAPHQDWDYKPYLQQRFGLKEPNDFYFQQPGTDRQVYYDIYSNMHYGFVGRAAGIDSDTLMKGGSLGEKVLTGVDDEGDHITQRAGMELYDKYGPNITEEQFHQGVVAAMDKMEAAQSEGKDVSQLRHAY
jgi:hypothetical protein